MSNICRYYQANRGVMANFLPDSYERVLEVGCGEGRFTEHLRPGCEVWGVEPNAEAGARAAMKMHRVLIGRYDQIADHLPNDYFDLVVCNDVIEHMDDHDVFLESIKQKMRRGGLIVGSIPNVRHITALFKLLILKDWKYSDSGILDRTHLRFFTAKSLRRTMQDHGYTIQAFAGIGGIISSGISRRMNKWEDLAYRMITLSVVVLSLGYYWDTQYPQYAFRVRLS